MSKNEEIHWLCPECENEGVISEWQKTKWITGEIFNIKILYHILYHKEKDRCNILIYNGLMFLNVGVAGFEPATLWS